MTEHSMTEQIAARRARLLSLYSGQPDPETPPPLPPRDIPAPIEAMHALQRRALQSLARRK